MNKQKYWMAPNEQYRLKFTMKAEEDNAEIMVYSEIASDSFWGDETTTGDFDKALKDARKKGVRNLNIRINSPGGEVYAAVAMRSMVINAGFDHVRIMIEGMCASAATLFATIPAAEVVIAQGSEFMIHNPTTIAWGNAEDIEKTVDHLRKMETSFHEMYAKKTGQPEERIKDWMDATTWFTAKETVEYGFCDKLLETEPVAACVTKRDMALMKAMYGDVPEQITEIKTIAEIFDNTQEEILPPADSTGKVSNGTPVAGVASEINTHKEETLMELENLTVEKLRDGNPALLAQIQQEAVDAERERLSDIDNLTVPGYEEMAEQAKATGMSAMDFHRQLVAEMKKKGTDFIQARREETAPAQDIVGGTPADEEKSEEQKIKDFANEVAGYAKNDAEYSGSGMF